MFLLLVSATLTVQAAFAQSTPPAWKEAQSAGYKYRFIPGDPMQARFYTLSNGLTVILSVNKKDPRIQTLIGVRAGSNSDPATHTGLAHYLEHLLFKGTSQYGSLDWAKENPSSTRSKNCTTPTTAPPTTPNAKPSTGRSTAFPALRPPSPSLTSMIR